MPTESNQSDPDGAAIRYGLGGCALGSLLVAGTGVGICAIFIGDDARALVHELALRFGRQAAIAPASGASRWLDEASALIEDPARPCTLALDLRGTPFQQRVWQALRDIPPGTTETYSDLATRIGAAGASRAVGSACGANPIAVAIPCHRVVRSDGGLGGYRWGLERKRALLEREVGLAVSRSWRNRQSTQSTEIPAASISVPSWPSSM